MAIPVIDLFAGPGGLGEGFASLTDRNRERVFQIRLSIEKDRYAHETLLLRAFFRQFRKGSRPQEYYDYLAGSLSATELFDSYPAQTRAASREAWLAELGGEATPDAEIDRRIREVVKSSSVWVL